MALVVYCNYNVATYMVQPHLALHFGTLLYSLADSAFIHDMYLFLLLEKKSKNKKVGFPSLPT